MIVVLLLQLAPLLGFLFPEGLAAEQEADWRDVQNADSFLFGFQLCFQNFLCFRNEVWHLNLYLWSDYLWSVFVGFRIFPLISFLLAVILLSVIRVYIVILEVDQRLGNTFSRDDLLHSAVLQQLNLF